MIPSRDRWPFLRTAVASALAQAEVDVRVVVVDDGSTDATPAELRAVRDPRMRVIRLERTEGVSRARNAGLAHVDAPWVAFLDDDDVWAPRHLSAMLAAAAGSGHPPERIGLVYCGHLEVDGARHVTHISTALPLEAVRERLPAMNPIGSPSRVLLRTDAVRVAGGFDERLSTLADWDLWARVLASREAVRSPELLVAYTSHAGNMQLDAERFLADLSVLDAKHGWDAAVRRDAKLARNIATLYRRGGRRMRAAGWYARSFRFGRAPRDLGRAIGMLLGERMIERTGLRRPEVVDPALGRWLEGVREAERATVSGLTPLPGPQRDLAAP